MRALRRLYARWLVRRGKAIDIESSGAYPANVLSNLCGNKFEIDGFQCGSMEGFLQALKFSDKQTQHQVCQMKGIRAKRKSSNAWKARQQLYWNGTDEPAGDNPNGTRVLPNPDRVTRPSGYNARGPERLDMLSTKVPISNLL